MEDYTKAQRIWMALYMVYHGHITIDELHALVKTEAWRDVYVYPSRPELREVTTLDNGSRKFRRADAEPSA